MVTEPEVRPDLRNTVPDIRSANTGELLKTSPMAQAEVESLFNGKKTSKPRVNSEFFKPPREFRETQKREMETEGDTNEERDDGAKRLKEDKVEEDEGDGFDDEWDDDFLKSLTMVNVSWLTYVTVITS